MMLYKFVNEQYGLEAIRDRRLKITRIGELNDPFEFLGLNLPKNGRKVLTNVKRQFANNRGLICMSSSWQNPLMWGHYTNNHQGLCLGFDISENIEFTEVSYVEARPTLKEIGLEKMSEFREKAMKKLLFSKYRAWEYEAEFRAFASLDERDPATDHYFFPFSQDMKLAQVVIGERSNITRNKLSRVLGSGADNVECFKARASFKRFEFVENKLKRAWK